jgi:L,D-transpeptidase YnhG
LHPSLPTPRVCETSPRPPTRTRRAGAGLALVVLAISLVGTAPAWAYKRHSASKERPAASVAIQPDADGLAEARLIDIYKLIGKGNLREAFSQAERLATDLPHFQLAQLVYGDLLAARIRPLRQMGDVPDAMAKAADNTLNELREESQRRVRALRERPPAGAIPAQFLQLSSSSQHAIAVDASRSRLYLFKNSSTGLELIADYYISVGKAGTSKTAEGDQRTPLGVYYITSNLNPKSLKDFYGSGALPINYPNVLDTRRGKTGSGIWLHGTPPNQFSRPPLATDGCVVLANPDLENIIRTVAIRSTPVLIAPQLRWVSPSAAQAEGKSFENTLLAWRNAKTAGDVARVLSFYTPDFNSNGKTLAQWTPTLKSEMQKMQGRTLQLKDVSYLRWTDSADTMVATFGEVPEGLRSGKTKRQYWIHQEGHWKIFFEGTL